MLNEPLLGLLPASESDILSINPRVHPDALLARLRRLERFGAVKRDKHGRYVKVEPKDDELDIPKGKRRNPLNESQLGERTCGCCGTTYKGITENFYNRRGNICKTCKDAKPGWRANMKTKVCVECGVERFPISRMFREDRKKGSRHYLSTCKVCEREAREKRYRQMRILRGEE